MATEQTGKSNSSTGVEQDTTPPWERVWNSAKAGVNNAIDTIQETTMKAVEAVKAPWEQSWGGSRSIERTTPSRPPTAPSEGMFEQVFSRLIGQESGGTHAVNGKLLESPAGAQGITQVMPKTGKSPGFGVTPIQDNTREEYVRFGKDYLKAMLKEFDGDYEKALGAYNAGAGSVKRAITKAASQGGDWKEYLPKRSETQPYIRNILKGIK